MLTLGLAVFACRLAGAQQPPAADPVTGWLIVSGPVAPGACGTTRAYDVDTGAVFDEDGCSGRVSAGRASVSAVRAAVVALSARRPGPWVVGPQLPTAVWRLVGGDAHPIGDLPLRATGHADDAVALQRLRDAEAHDRAGCAPPLPPTPGVLAAAPLIMRQPVGAHAAQHLADRYRAARERWAALEGCGGGEF
ncbi:MAG: hypothetical protein R2712_14305 [Vicinamibacterales bacterium]